MAAEQTLRVIVRRRSNGDRIADTPVIADPGDITRLREIRHALVTGDGWDAGRVPEFDMQVLAAAGGEITTIGG